MYIVGCIWYNQCVSKARRRFTPISLSPLSLILTSFWSLQQVRVFARIRPPKKDPTASSTSSTTVPLSVLPVGTTDIQVVDHSSAKRTSQRFELDKVFSTTSTQRGVFSEVRPLIGSAVDGHNICVFAYGQTGSGKTWTMQGEMAKDGPQLPQSQQRSPRAQTQSRTLSSQSQSLSQLQSQPQWPGVNAGIMPRSLLELLTAIRAAKRAGKGGDKCENGEDGENEENGENGDKEGGSATTATLTASVVEIYNDVIVDLLSPRPSSASRGSRTPSSSSSSSSSSVSSLQVCMGKDGTVSVPGLTHCELPLDDARAGWCIIEEGMARR